MIIANRVGDDCGFDCDENTVDVFWPGGEQSFPMAAKSDLASDLMNLVALRYATVRGDSTEPRLSVVSLRQTNK